MASYDVVGTGNGLEVVAIENGSRIGRISFEISGDLCSITYIFVNPEFRRRGIASMMMIKLWDHIFDKTDVEEISVVLPHEDETLGSFLEKMEFGKTETIGEYVSFSVSTVLECDIMQKIDPDNDDRMIALGKLRSPGLVESLGDILGRMDYIKSAKEFYSEYDQKCSTIAVKEDRVIGYSAVKKISEKKVMLSFLYIDPKERAEAAGLIKATASAVSREYGEDCVVTAFPAFAEGKKLLDKLVDKEARTSEPVAGYRLFIYEEGRD